MQAIGAVLSRMGMIFLMIAIGFYMEHRGVFTEKVIKGVNAILVQVAWPAMIIMTTQTECTPERMRGFAWVLVISTAIMALFLAGFGYGTRKWLPEKKNAIFALLCGLPNSGFMGLPIIEVIYGEEGVLYMAAVSVGFNLAAWTIGSALLEGKAKNPLKPLWNVGFVFTVIGTLLFFLNIRLPDFLLDTSKQLGSLCTPLSMLLLGTRFKSIRGKTLRDGSMWLAVGVKLLLMPALAWGISLAVPNCALPMTVMVILMGMPSAALCQVLAEKYNHHTDYAVTGMCVSLVLSILTIPLTVLILGA